MTPAPRAVIADALWNWWTTTDPVEPFAPTTVAADVELHLISSGYRITHDDRTKMPTPRTAPTCDASTRTEFDAFGPCVLRQDHDGPVHRDTSGATWWRTTSWYPSRASITVNALIVAACLTATVVSLIAGHWWWTTAGGIASVALTHALVDELAERRAHRRGRRT